MGVYTVTEQIPTTISAKRMFMALVADYHNLIPKLAPTIIKNVDFVEGGEGHGVGTIKQTNFQEGAPYKFLKHKIDEVDEEKLTSTYTLIAGDVLGENLESIVYDVKFEESGTGSIATITNTYHTKGDFKLTEEDKKAEKERAMGMYKLVEDYLLANPDVYAQSV